jgi:hypothetical protein
MVTNISVFLLATGNTRSFLQAPEDTRRNVGLP